MEFIMKSAIERLKEKTTWAGIIAVLAGLGVTVNPELATYGSGLVISIAGIVSIFTKETK